VRARTTRNAWKEEEEEKEKRKSNNCGAAAGKKHSCDGHVSQMAEQTQGTVVVIFSHKL